MTVERDEKGYLLPGSILNPTGRPKLPEEVREIRKMQMEKLIRLFDSTGKLTVNELKARMKEKDVTSDELMILSARVNAMNGDTKAFNTILDRVLGKATQHVELTGADGSPLKTGFESLSDLELEVLHQKMMKRSEK